jgi:hypothetical protein
LQRAGRSTILAPHQVVGSPPASDMVLVRARGLAGPKVMATGCVAV